MADIYEFREAAGGLDHINKFAKSGLNYDLVEVWVLQDNTKATSTEKEGWKVYDGDAIKNLVFTNKIQENLPENTILITEKEPEILTII